MKKSYFKKPGFLKQGEDLLYDLTISNETDIKCCLRPILPEFFWGDEYGSHRDNKRFDFPRYQLVNTFSASHTEYFTKNGKALAIIQSFSRRRLLQIIKGDTDCKRFLKQLHNRYQKLIDFTRPQFLAPAASHFGVYWHNLDDIQSKTAEDYKNFIHVLNTERLVPATAYDCTVEVYYNINAICLLPNLESPTVNIALDIEYLIPQHISCIELDRATRQTKTIKVTHHRLSQEKPIVGRGLFISRDEDLTLKGQEII